MEAHFGPKKLYRLEPGSEASEFIENCREIVKQPDTVVFTAAGSGSTGSDGPSELLLKILGAAGLDAERRIIVNADTYPELRLRMLRRIFPSLLHVLLFGSDLSRIGLNASIPPYTPVKIGKYTVLKAGQLEAISASEDSKRQLWNSMKEMFGL